MLLEVIFHVGENPEKKLFYTFSLPADPLLSIDMASTLYLDIVLTWSRLIPEEKKVIWHNDAAAVKCLERVL